MSPRAHLLTGSGSFKDYVSIARLDHWLKHVFILPGIVFSLILGARQNEEILLHCFLGFGSAFLIASSNYVLNEWLDAESDRHHPLKCHRPAARGHLSAPLVYIEYAIFAIVGLSLAVLVSPLFMWVSVLFAVSGICYNVRPIRTKERVFLDVLTESFNNPIRMLLGWSMVSSFTIPPISLLLTYWVGGAFLMSTKRLAEYRFVKEAKGSGALRMYRISFGAYTETSLLISCFVYGQFSAFGIGIFLTKYRSEFVLSIPLFVLLFAYYLYLSLQEQSVTQAPERLYRERALWAIILAILLSVTLLAVVDIPFIHNIVQSRFKAITLGQ